mgnify:CR=1 FL=1
MRAGFSTHSLMRTEDQPWGQIEIQDTGTGIAPDHLARVFDPFFTTKPPSGDETGTGLGLTIAQQIVQAHGGDMQVASTKGVGTTVWVNVPGAPCAKD